MRNQNSTNGRNLSHLNPGEYGIVSHINHDAPAAHRLLALGLMPGIWLRYLRAAPLGDPLLVELPEALISLRRRDAVLVEVREKEP